MNEDTESAAKLIMKEARDFAAQVLEAFAAEFLAPEQASRFTDAERHRAALAMARRFREILHEKSTELRTQAQSAPESGGEAVVQMVRSQFDNWAHALRFYANKFHFMLGDEDAWDTVSGEPQNYWCDEAGTATVEDGSIAKMALCGEIVNWLDGDTEELPPVIDGEQSDHPPAQSANAQWLPIESAPKDATDILVVTDAGHRFVVHWAHGGGEDQPPFGPGWFYWTGYMYAELNSKQGKPTHWMPLPDPPKSHERAGLR